MAIKFKMNACLDCIFDRTLCRSWDIDQMEDFPLCWPLGLAEMNGTEG